jgi:glycosyltransferase involved in cell wall biosynthesis
MAGCPAYAIRTGAIAVHSKVNNNLEVIRSPRVDMPPSRLWYQLMNLSSIRHRLTDFDIVHAQDQSAFPLIYFCKRDSAKIPWVVTLHGDPISELNYGMRSILALESSVKDVFINVAGFPLSDLAMRMEARLADALVSVSQQLHEEIHNKYHASQGKLFTILNGINIAGLENEANVGAIHRSTTKIVDIFYAGRLYWRKGIVHLIKSVAYMTAKFKFSEYRLTIFGEGPLRRTLSSLISKFNLKTNVRLQGFVPREELITAMARSDIVCVPSLYEACPMAMMEAMILAKPVVTFNRPFSQELLSGVPDAPMATSIPDYASRLYSLCTSEGLRADLGGRLRDVAVERFDVEKTAKKYIELYETLLES